MCRLVLRNARKSRRLSQEKVARAIGFNGKQGYSNLETGRRGTTAKKWDALEDFFRIDQRILRQIDT